LKKSLFNPPLLITLLLFVAVAIMACTPQPALAGDCIVCHSTGDPTDTISMSMKSTGESTRLAMSDTDEGFGMALAATQTMGGLPSIRDLTKTVALDPARKTSVDRSAHIGAGSENFKSMSKHSTAVAIASIGLPTPDH